MTHHNKITLLADLFILLICFLGTYQIYKKSDLPFRFEDYKSRLVVEQIYNKNASLQPGDVILSVQNIPVLSRDEIETITDGMNIGETASLTVLRNDVKISTNAILIKFYSDFYIFCVLISGLIFFIVAAAVVLKSPKTKVAQVFHWVTVGTAVIIMTTWGNYSILPFGIGHIVRILFHLAYVFVPVCFLHFTFIFPTENYVRQRNYLHILYAFSFILFLTVHIPYYLFVNLNFTEYLRPYSLAFNIVRTYLVLCIIAAISVFIVSYRSAITVLEKKKLKWILFSLILGPGGYILLWVTPQAVMNYALIPEELLVLLMVNVPIGFAIAIVKHHLFDIDQIINRSLVYSVLISGIILIYMALVYVTTFFVPGIDKPFISILVITFVAFLFEPVKAKVQLFVDKRFFKVRYNFRAASKKLLEEIRNSGDIPKLSNKIIVELDKIIPVDKIGFFVCRSDGSNFQMTAGNNFDADINYIKNEKSYSIDLSEASGSIEKIETGALIKAEKSFQLKLHGISLLFPVKSTENKLLGVLLIGSRKSGHLFTIEDIDLYNSVVLESGINIEKIQLYESLIRKQLEQEKLLEMSQLKSFFLSSVTHDLKTPITSIKMFAELLECGNNLSDEQKEEYPSIIMGECGRLTRLIDNILDLTKIEKGIKQYHFSVVDMEELVRYALSIMTYQIKLEECNLTVNFPQEEECLIYADPDSFISAAVNLISNALKYSAAPKEISICVFQESDNAVFKIFNNCPELSPEELAHLSEIYFRTESSRNSSIQGNGLGLYLVRQIIQAHNGTLKINNESGRGCSFTITIPLWRPNAKDINN